MITYQHKTQRQEFLSTPSARRATQYKPGKTQRRHNFYPRPPRGGRPPYNGSMFTKSFISIHALREEGDEIRFRLFGIHCAISIHALREEGDYPRLIKSIIKTNFYPRPPRGGRPTTAANEPQQTDFYPRPPRGGRRKDKKVFTQTAKFLSTPSARRATVAPLPDVPLSALFLSTPSARRATMPHLLRRALHQHFYPRPPRGGRRGKVYHGLRHNNFYPRPPRGGRRTHPEPAG